MSGRKIHGRLKDIIGFNTTMILHMFVIIAVLNHMKHAMLISDLITMCGKLHGVENGSTITVINLIKIFFGTAMQVTKTSIENIMKMKLELEAVKHTTGLMIIL